MKLRFGPLYPKMWRSNRSTPTGPVAFTGTVEGAVELWALVHDNPTQRLLYRYPLGVGYLPFQGAGLSPILMPMYIQPRGEP